MELTKDLFELFTGDGHVRQPLNEITQKESYAIATNGHILIRAGLDDTDFTPETVEGYPDNTATMVDKYKKLVNDIQPRRINLSDLKKTLSDVPKEEINKVIDCSYCGGDGYEYCDYCGQETECDHCAGSGEMITDQVTGRQYSTAHNVRIDVHYYKAKPLQIIVDAAQKLNQDAFTWYSIPDKTYLGPGALITMPNVEILLMPVRMFDHNPDEDEQSLYVHILPTSEPASTD